MDTDEEIEFLSVLYTSSAAVLALCQYEEHRKHKVRKSRQWIKSWRQNILSCASHHVLLNELRLQDKDAYRRYLRMDEECFIEILNAIKDDIPKQDTLLREAIPAAEKLSVSLKYLATGETFRSLEYQSKLSLSTISECVPQVCDFIYKRLKDKYLRFPRSHQEWKQIAEQFAIRWQFPSCIGALDGKHIAFRASKKFGNFYYNYKGFNSVVLLAMCDANYKFTFVDIGCNGRSSDGGVLNQSDLRQFLLQSSKYVPEDEVIGNNRIIPFAIIGDAAFPLETHIMKPYPYNSIEKDKQIFNYRLSHARQTIEHGFGILSNRFRVFQTTIHLCPSKVILLTQASCVLHNMLSEKNHNYIDPIVLTTNKFSYSDNGGKSENPKNYAKSASEVRKKFTDYFVNEGAIPWQDGYI